MILIYVKILPNNVERSLDIKADECHLINTINIGNPISKFEADMPLFQNIPDFRNSKSAALDFFSFADVLLIFLEKYEVIFPFSRVKQVGHSSQGHLRSVLKLLKSFSNFYHQSVSMKGINPENFRPIPFNF